MMIMTLLSKPLNIRKTRTVSWITRITKTLENNFVLQGDNNNDDDADNGHGDADDDNDDDDEDDT